AGEEYFLANYADGLTDLSLADQMSHFLAHDKVASFVSVKPNLSFHLVNADERGRVTAMEEIGKSHIRINGGFFIFRHDIFSYIREGEELVIEPFQRLVSADQLVAYQYDGFWQAMDTFKDRQHLEQLDSSGNAPWELWKDDAARGTASLDVHAALEARRFRARTLQA